MISANGKKYTLRKATDIPVKKLVCFEFVRIPLYKIPSEDLAIVTDVHGSFFVHQNKKNGYYPPSSTAF
jgi:hypothetical protein